MEYKEVYESWLANPYFDEATKQELLSIKDDENEIKERFYADLEFGTAGLRGVIGAGTNRMNVYVVRKTTQGLANYIIKQNAADKGVAIAFDSRRMSTEFANEAALCLAANGIKAYIFDALRPTPELSFAVRYLGCTAGINITASHNPPEYNGYKVYWADGAQITPPHDSGIMAEVKAVTDAHGELAQAEQNIAHHAHDAGQIAIGGPGVRVLRIVGVTDKQTDQQLRHKKTSRAALAACIPNVPSIAFCFMVLKWFPENFARYTKTPAGCVPCRGRFCK